MDISILLATYRRPDMLVRTLESFCHLTAEELDWEVIVVDNADDEDTRQIVERFRSVLEVTCLVERKRGKNNALNRGLEGARGELLIFTDDDVIADPMWLIEMWEGAARWPDHAVFGGRIIPKFDSTRIPISKKHPFFRGAYVLADWEIDEGPYDASYVWGPNMAVRAEIFRKGWRFNTDVGPNGGNYIMGSETEFTVRLEKEGFRSVYLPGSLVFHQIRPEQLKAKWLYGRSFRDGRQKALWYGRPDVPSVFGVPRYMIRQLIEARIKRLLYFYDRERAIDFGIKYWNIKGMLYQYWKGLPETKRVTALPDVSLQIPETLTKNKL
ncbi:MAG: glycosyltransferase family 2 protein [Nitrospirota bacterium]